MSVNRYLPHVMVLPEDDANREIANGFHLKVDWTRQMQVLPVAGGWNEVLSLFNSEHVKEMDGCPTRFMVLLIDCDNNRYRLDDAKATIPDRLADRVFILGVLSEPEALKPDLGSLEKIGSGLADDCRDGTETVWGHNLLRHNANELALLRERIRPILFSDPAEPTE